MKASVDVKSILISAESDATPAPSLPQRFKRLPGQKVITNRENSRKLFAQIIDSEPHLAEWNQVSRNYQPWYAWQYLSIYEYLCLDPLRWINENGIGRRKERSKTRNFTIQTLVEKYEYIGSHLRPPL